MLPLRQADSLQPATAALCCPAAGPDPLSSVPPAPTLAYKLADHGSSTGRFVVRCAFGGSDANFVVHGGEDSKVGGGAGRTR